MTLHAPAPDKLGTKVRDEQYRSPVGPGYKSLPKKKSAILSVFALVAVILIEFHTEIPVLISNLLWIFQGVSLLIKRG